MNDEKIIDDILKAEGWPVYTNDENDRGGPTKGGITQATLAAWRGHPVTPEDVENLSRVEACAIYRKQYIEASGFDKIRDDALRAQVIDAGVLHGTGTASRWLQSLVKVPVDGKFGPISQVAVNDAPAKKLAVAFAVKRIRFMGQLVAANYAARRAGRTAQDQSRFAEGWLNRATSFLEEA